MNILQRRPLILLISLLPVLSVRADRDFQQTDNISIYFGKEDNQAHYVADQANYFYLGVKLNIEHITALEIIDVSAPDLQCTDDIPASPTNLARYKIDPDTTLKQVAVYITLPCAAYHEKWDLMVRVKSAQGGYYTQQRMPVKVSMESPGYPAGDKPYSGKLLRPDQ
ncbi:MAG: hypothetical protein OEZ39_18275 [Gammaproteobacteria bacterium]|nr:hypothetical protein [Gammaproteobacteria bacterium]MDH5653814.1 hypothetical protein [Gammaproteobacteria bacterium]